MFNCLWKQVYVVLKFAYNYLFFMACICSYFVICAIFCILNRLCRLFQRHLWSFTLKIILIWEKIWNFRKSATLTLTEKVWLLFSTSFPSPDLKTTNGLLFLSFIRIDKNIMYISIKNLLLIKQFYLNAILAT